MHRLPNGTTLHIGFVKSYAHSLNICVGFEPCMQLPRRMDHTGRTTNSALNSRCVSFVLSANLNFRIKSDRVEPEVGKNFMSLRGMFWINLHVTSTMVGNPVNFGKGIGIKFGHMTVVGNMLIENCHLSAPDTSADITQAIIKADLLMLIIGKSLAGLSGKEHDSILRRLIRADQCTSTTCSNHFITIETEYTIFTESSAHTAIISGA